MKIRRFFGKDMREALRQVKAELGSDAVIMSNRKVADGVELVAAYDKEPKPQLKPVVNTTAPVKTPSLSEIIGDDGPDSLKALLEKQAASNKLVSSQPPAAKAPPVGNETQMRDEQHADMFTSTVVTSTLSDGVVNDESIKGIKQELSSLREILQFQMADLIGVRRQQQRPFYHYVVKNLMGMGLTEQLAAQLVEYTPAQLDEQSAWRYALNLLANRVVIDKAPLHQQTGVVALVGATGTGKTTTVAKIAARCAQQYGAEQVAMVTIDSYRIAAFEQLATYGRIIGCVVKQAANSESLAEILHQLRHKRLILIDTAGFSQRDSRLIQQLDMFNTVSSANVKKCLLLSASAQYASLQATIHAYEQTPIDGCILTKLDECYSLGDALSAIVEHQLSLRCITDGQQVPEDIKVADAKTLVSVAARLYKKFRLNHTSQKRA